MAGRSTEEKAGKIGPAIKSKREEIGISQLELAVRAETSQRENESLEKIRCSGWPRHWKQPCLYFLVKFGIRIFL